MPAADLRARLQRLRLQKAKRQLPPSVPLEVLNARSEAHKALPRAQAGPLPGHEVATPLGAYQLIEESYALDFQHGPRRLVEVFQQSAAVAARLARDDALAGADLRSLAFLDTETTGLMGGAGTLVFLVGVGFCDGDRFVLRQYFLRDPAEEEAMLTALVSDLAARAGWVTFNGRAFDLPLLESRLTLNRQRGALGRRPHLDLLAPARRLYRGRLASCSLSHLEQHVFSIFREQDDVPGALIPQLYQDYLRTGDAGDMHRVIYHNAVDILSMVTLAAHVLELFATPLSQDGLPPRGQRAGRAARGTAVGAGRRRRPASPDLHPEDLLRLACWHDDQSRWAEAEAAYRQALEGKVGLDARRLGLTRLAGMLKRLGRRAEAVPLWEQLASFTLDDPQPFVELAKYYEWYGRDSARALKWTERAQGVVAGWPAGWRREAITAELQHRINRLTAKRPAGRAG